MQRFRLNPFIAAYHLYRRTGIIAVLLPLAAVLVEPGTSDNSVLLTRI